MIGINTVSAHWQVGVEVGIRIEAQQPAIALPSELGGRHELGRQA